MDNGFDFSWDKYTPNNQTEAFFLIELENQRKSLLDTFMQSRKDIDEKIELIIPIVKRAKTKKWDDIFAIWNPALFILQRDKALKLIVERLTETEDKDKIISASKDACLEIFETLQKIQTLFAAKFYKAARSYGTDELIIKNFNIQKKAIGQFDNEHSSSLKRVRDSVAAHFDDESLFHEYISSAISRLAILKLCTEFGKLAIQLSQSLQPIMNISASSHSAGVA